MRSFYYHQNNGEKVGLLPILSVNHPITIGTMLNFNSGNNGHGLNDVTCRKIFTVEPPFKDLIWLNVFAIRGKRPATMKENLYCKRKWTNFLPGGQFPSVRTKVCMYVTYRPVKCALSWGPSPTYWRRMRNCRKKSWAARLTSCWCKTHF